MSSFAPAPRPKARPPAYAQIAQRGDFGAASSPTPLPAGSFTYLGPYGMLNVAASLTNSAMTVAAVSGSNSNVVVPFDGSLVGFTLRSSQARTAGTATVECWRNSASFSTAATLTLDGTNTTQNTTTYPAGLLPFLAGDLLSVVVTTTGAWTPTTADLVAALFLEFRR